MGKKIKFLFLFSLALSIGASAAPPEACKKAFTCISDPARGTMLLTFRSESKPFSHFEVEYLVDLASDNYLPWAFKEFDESGRVLRSRSNGDPIPCGIPSSPKAITAMVVEKGGIPQGMGSP